MEKLKNKNMIAKIIFAVTILIIVIGTILTVTVGLNFDLKYQEAETIELYLEKDFENKDIANIVKEVKPNEDVIVEKVEVFEDTALITAKEITDEQKEEIINKVNEKYETELSADEIDVEKVPSLRGRDIIKPYIAPVITATIIILIYMAIRYFKLGTIKVLLKTIWVLFIIGAMFISIMAITRIPVCEFTMPAALTLYILTLLVINNAFEKQAEKLKEEKE